jgi:hypothetical protein
VSEEGTAHALFAGVGGAEDHGLVGHQLAEASGPGGDVRYETFEVSQVVADRLGYAYAAGLAVPQCELEGAEQTGAPRDSGRDEPELAEGALPLFTPGSLAATEGVKDLVEPVGAVIGHLERLAEGVQDPAQGCLAGGPGGLALPHFLDRGRLLTRRMVGLGL